MKKAIKIILIVIGILFVLLIGIAMGTSGDDNTTTTTTTQAEQKQEKEEKSTTSTTTTTTSNETIGQRNAIAKAKTYLNVSAFSRKGLKEQLEFEKFSAEDIEYALNHIDVDYKEQAAKKAKTYIDMSSFSRDGLIEQLEFEGYTHEEAVYGVEAVGY